MAGFEPALSCSQGRRIEPGFPTSRTKCPAGVEPALPPWQGDRLPLHHGHSFPTPNCQGNREHRVGLEPTSPHYGCGVFAARRPVLITGVGPEGLEPSPAWLRARGSATRALAPHEHHSQSNSSRPRRSRTFVFRLSAECSPVELRAGIECSSKCPCTILGGRASRRATAQSGSDGLRRAQSSRASPSRNHARPFRRSAPGESNPPSVSYKENALPLS
jgi:hypothetical protein